MRGFDGNFLFGIPLEHEKIPYSVQGEQNKKDQQSLVCGIARFPFISFVYNSFPLFPIVADAYLLKDLPLRQGEMSKGQSGIDGKTAVINISFIASRCLKGNIKTLRNHVEMDGPIENTK